MWWCRRPRDRRGRRRLASGHQLDDERTHRDGSGMVPGRPARQEGATGIEFDRNPDGAGPYGGARRRPGSARTHRRGVGAGGGAGRPDHPSGSVRRCGRVCCPGRPLPCSGRWPAWTPGRLGEIALAISGPGAVAWSAGAKAPWWARPVASHGIGGGTTEMGLNAIAERLLGLPREPGTNKTLPFNALRHNRVEIR